MRGSRIIDNPFSKIIEIQDKMFQVKRVLPISRVKIDKYDNWASLLKEYYKEQVLKSQDFYFENGYKVMTEKYHLKRGYCCNNKCRHCPYEG